eukprot:GEMP01117303.1.p1 GENE.GEMP01117303.1~~GEMP01117303.1.p1  ORF type:complete len:135 (+),score=38.32 GEMP01117303.1:47-406(+)
MSQVRVLHLLCKHEGSRNPVSRRTNASTESTTKGQAHTELQQYQQQFQGLSGAELQKAFETACSARSDCGSFAKKGDLDFFGRGAMQKPFEDASFSLEVGQMSGIVDTDSGSHLILRIA